MKTPLIIETNKLKKAALQYRAINNPLRQKILFFIHRKGTITVTPLYKALKLEQSVASMQLAILRKAKLVNTKREGKQVFYTVNYGQLNLLGQQTERLLGKSSKPV